MMLNPFAFERIMREMVIWLKRNIAGWLGVIRTGPGDRDLKPSPEIRDLLNVRLYSFFSDKEHPDLTIDVS